MIYNGRRGGMIYNSKPKQNNKAKMAKGGQYHCYLYIIISFKLKGYEQNDIG